MPEPGARISHAAVAVAAQVGCPLIWVGEAGVRVYSEASRAEPGPIVPDAPGTIGARP